jgi:hypothetical protein
MRLMPQIDPEGTNERKATDHLEICLESWSLFCVASKWLPQVKAIWISNPWRDRRVQSTHYMSPSMEQQQLVRIDSVILP